MAYPKINELLCKAENRFTLVIEVAKRARQLLDGAVPLLETTEKNPLLIAIEEVENDKVTYFRNNHTEV